ncbi:MAG: GGDEF domain-containing protein [Sporichthyaceae bacterium]
MTRTRTTMAVSLLLGGALLALGVTTGASVLAISRSNAGVTEARAVLVQYSGLQRAVSGEAFAEAGYRRSPGPASRGRLERLIRGVQQAVHSVRAVGDRQDGALLSYVQVLNARYAGQVRTELDAPAAGTRDDRVAGPALDAIQRLIDGAVDGHRAEANAAQEDQRRLLGRLGVVLPVVFLLAFSMLGWSWWAMLREHRRLHRSAVVSERRALTDPLTGLANRDGLRLAMDDVLEARDPASALLLLDLDEFKPVNDTFGHHAGDEVLREIARRVGLLVRPGDVVARLGGDEFAVFLGATADPQVVADRILAAVRQPVTVEGHDVRVSTSIGIARAPRDARDTARLLRAADGALYTAKTAGRGRAVSATKQAATSLASSRG